MTSKVADNSFPLSLSVPAIGTVFVIVAVFASSLRGRRGVQQIATIEVADGEHLPVIEELSAGRIPPRD